MADRRLPELRSRLRVDTSDLDRAGREADKFRTKLGQPVGPTGGDGGAFTSMLERNSQGLEKFGRQATRNLTLPLIAAGAASTKLSLDFDATFQRMVSLAGVAASEVDGLKEAVKKLASETGKGPQDLAEGLEVIRSAGITGAEALDVLGVSAKASAIGLGTTREVADAVTSVLNSYGSATISAVQATDILAGSVEAAKVEAAEMAPQFGRLLPLASTLGISFDQVGGSLAFLTRGSGDASLASAQLGGVLQKLLNPSKQSRDTLKEIGLSIEDLQSSLRTKGLVPTLELLDEKLGHNQQKLARFFEDAQGVQGVLALLGSDQGAGAAQVIADVGDSVGRTAEAFEALQKTDNFKLQKALAELKVSMIDLGSTLAPLVTSLAKDAAGLAKAFTALPGPIRTGLLVIVGLVGPVSSALGRIGANIDRLTGVARRGESGLDDLGTAGTGMATKLSAAATVVAAGIVAYTLTTTALEALSAGYDDTQGHSDYLATSFEILGQKGKLQGDLLASFGDGLVGLGAAFNALPDDKGEALGQLFSKPLGQSAREARGAKDAIDKIDQALADFAKSSPENAALAEKAYGQIARMLIAQGIDAGDVAGGFDTYLGVLHDSRLRNEELGPAADSASAALDGQGDAAAGAAEAHKTLLQTLVDEMSLQNGLVTARNAASDAIQAYADNEAAAAGQGKEIADIRSDAARQEADDSKNIASLRKAEADARAGVTKAIEDEKKALDDVHEAEKKENELKAKSAELERDLTAAKEEAQKQLDKLPATVEGAKLDVADAHRATQAAHDVVFGNAENDPIVDNPDTTVDEHAAAVDDLRRSELAEAEAKQNAVDIQKDANEQQAAGVDGSKPVLDAQAAIASNDKAIADAHDGVIEANGRLQDSHDAVTEAEGRQADAATATADAVDESARRQEEAEGKISDIVDAAKAKRDELKIAADEAVGAWAIAAEKAGLPIEAIKQGIAFLADQALPGLRDLINNFFSGLTTSFAPPGSEADQGLFNLASQAGRSGKGARSGFVRGVDASTVDTSFPAVAGSTSNGGTGRTVNVQEGAFKGLVQVIGNPDATQLARMERVARAAIDEALQEVAS